MADKTLQAVIKMKDFMSPVLKTVKSNVEALKVATSGVTKSTRDMSERMNSARSNTEKAGKSFKGMEESLKSVGKSATKAGIAISGIMGIALGNSLKDAMSFESAFAGVKKTVEATPKQLETIKKGILDMTTQMPQSAEDICKVSEAAGQLGIHTDSILGFTKTMTMLGDATNLTSDDAAKTLARFANITQMPQDEFDRLGATIVHLGNNLATEESDITDMALRLAGAGKQIGLSNANIMSFAGALSSVGIEAEAGGSSFSKMMIEMQLATEKGGKKLKDLANISGMSSSQFKQAFKNDASNAIISFIKGLQNTESSGKSTIKILDDLGVKEVRLRDSLLRAAGSGDLFNKSLEIGDQAWKDNIALLREANERYGTTESQIGLFKNTMRLLSIEIGESMLPVVKRCVKASIDFVQGFRNMSKGTKQTIVRIGLVISAIGALLLVFGILSLSFIGIKKAFTDIKKVMMLFSSPVGWIVLVILALAGAFIYCYRHSKKFRDAVHKTTQKLKEMAKPIVDFLVPHLKKMWESIKELGKSFGPLIDSIGEFASVIMPILAPVVEFIIGFFILKIKYALIIFAERLRAVIDTVTGVIKGLTKVFKGVAMIIDGIVHGDMTKAGEGLELLWDGIVDTVSSLWRGFIDWFTAPVNAIIDILDDIFKGKADWIKKTWDEVRKWLEHPIQGTIDIVQSWFGSDDKKPQNAFGLNRVSRNGEVHSLHEGERVLTKQESNKLDRGTGAQININISELVVREEADINLIATKLYKKIKENKINYYGGVSL